MTNFEHEQFPSEPLLPVVTQETVGAFEANTSESLDLFLAAETQMKQEQPMMLAWLDSMIELGSRDKLESVHMAVVAVSVYTLLKMQAEAASREAPSEDQSQNRPVLPYIAEETVYSFSGSMRDVGLRRMSRSTLESMMEGQPALAQKLNLLSQKSMRDETEGFNMGLMGVTVYKLLEMQAESDRLNQQFNPDL
jgi:hypothetical protein